MMPDGVAAPASNLPTPMFSPLPSETLTPHLNGKGGVGDYLSAALGKKATGRLLSKTYIGGSRALDSLARMIASTESFFHPSNSGSWTNDVSIYALYLHYRLGSLWNVIQLSAFIKYIVYNFNKSGYGLFCYRTPLTAAYRMARGTTTRLQDSQSISSTLSTHFSGLILVCSTGA